MVRSRVLLVRRIDNALILILKHLPRISRPEALLVSYVIHSPNARKEFSVVSEFGVCHSRFLDQDFLLPSHPTFLDHLWVPERNDQRDYFEVSHRPEAV